MMRPSRILTRFDGVQQLASPWSRDTPHTLNRFKLRHTTGAAVIPNIHQQRDKTGNCAYIEQSINPHSTSHMTTEIVLQLHTSTIQTLEPCSSLEGLA